MRRDVRIRAALVRLLPGAVALVALTALPLSAQGTKPAPRLSNGKPDFTGVWDHPRVGDISRSVDGPCAGGSKGCKNIVSGELSFTPAGKIEWDKNNKPTTYDYGSHCQPWGFVRAYNTPYPHAYVHHPNRLVILWEQDNRFHVVPTDGRELPKDLEPTWMGTSVGRWEGDTLVVQTAGFNGRTWLDTAQHPHSDALRLTIRMTRPDYDHLNWEVTIEDPKYYTIIVRARSQETSRSWSSARLSFAGQMPSKRELLQVLREVRRRHGAGLTLEQLAERARWSPFHLHRTFSEMVGETPKGRAHSAASSGRPRQAIARLRSPGHAPVYSLSINGARTVQHRGGHPHRFGGAGAR